MNQANLYVTIGEYLYNKPRPGSCLYRNPYTPHSTHTEAKVDSSCMANVEPYRPPVRSKEIRENYSAPTTTEPILNTSDPKVWGPPKWFDLHVSAAHYPLEASPLVRERTKGRILAIPYEISCRECMTHASAFIESKKDKLDEIVSGRHALGKFYVDFHNKVNERHGKPLWTYEQAYAKYSGQAE